MGITAKELAEKLQISAATVSMVLNDKPGISELTRARVLEAAMQYGCVTRKGPEAADMPAIHFIIYKKHGTVIADTPFFAQLTEGITQQCREEHFLLQVSYLYENEDIQNQLRTIQSVTCCGILLLGTEMEVRDFDYFKNCSLPLVVLDCYYDQLDTDCILINNIQGAFLATKYLFDHGHRNIGYIKSRVSISNFEERSDGYYKALRSLGLATSHPYVLSAMPDASEGYDQLMSVLEKRPPLASAYFADNDILAAAAIRAFKAWGYRIPEDISIIGFDDMPMCPFLDPPLTTMNVQKENLGALAVRRLILKAKTNGKDKIKMAVSTELMERNSVCLKK